MKKTIVLTLVILGLAAPTAVLATSMTDNKRMRIFAGLDLSNEQKQDIREIMRQMRQDNAIYAGEKQDTHNQMQQLMSLPEWDEAVAEQLLSTSIDTRLVLETNRAFARHQVANLLDEDQLTEIESRWNDGEMRDRREHMERKMARRLNLTDEQQSQAADIMSRQKALLAAYEDQLKEHRMAEKALIRADEFDRDAYVALNDAFKQTQLEIALLRAKTRYDMAQILTDEQREKAAKQRSKIRNKMKNRS